MARQPRIAFEGALYHITFRGNARQRIFLDDRDRVRFLASLAERVGDHEVRLYMYCLMGNHGHLLVETPKANISAFMGSLLTSYTVYFNLRHRRAGHVTQGRYGSPLVEGDEYLLRLSRYVHLNPVFVGEWEKASFKERIGYLRSYRWSSYRGYVGLAEKDEFVDYAPVHGLMESRGRGAARRYRAYVEAGLAETDEDWLKIMKESREGIGSEEFRGSVRVRYEEDAGSRVRREDVAFRRTKEQVDAEKILEAVCGHFGVSAAELKRRRMNDPIRPVAAALLTRKGGLTQREVAQQLGLSTGAAVCLQLKRLKTVLARTCQPALNALEKELTI